MTMTDPIADMLTRLRNANSAYHDTVAMPYSQDQVAHRRDPPAGGLHRLLARRGRRGRQEPRGHAEVRPEPRALIAGIRRVSKPGLRVYAKTDNLPKVLGGLGVAIISTSTGLLTDRQAKKKGVGGEVLAYVW